MEENKLPSENIPANSELKPIESSPCQSPISTETNISSNSSLPITNPDDETHTAPSSKSGTMPLKTTNNILDESSDKSVEMPDIASGFNSAESTSDADFFTTRKAVLSAIDLIDEGSKDQESLMDNSSQSDNNIDIVTSKNEGEMETEASCSENAERKLNEDNVIGESDLVTPKSIDISECHSTEDGVISKENISIATVNEEISGSPVSSDDKTTSLTNKEINSEKINDSMTSNETNTAKNMDNEETNPLKANDTKSDEMKFMIDSKDEDVEMENLQTIESGVKNEVNIDDVISGSPEKCIVDTKVAEETCSEGSTDSPKLGEMKMEVEQSELPNRETCKNKSDDSSEVIDLDAIPSTDNKNNEKKIRSSLPVSVEISDVEVSVFKYERNKEEKSKTSDEFKLDDMVLSSDEENDETEIKVKSPGTMHTSKNNTQPHPLLNIDPYLSDSVEKHLSLDIGEGVDGKDLETTTIEDSSKEHQNTCDKLPETEVMDVDSNPVQGAPTTNEPEGNNGMHLEEKDNVPSKNFVSPEPDNPNIITEGNPTQELSNSSDTELKSSKNEEASKSSDFPFDARKDGGVDKQKDDVSADVESKRSDVSDLEDLLKTTLANNEKFREELSKESNEESNKKSTENTEEAEVICLVDDDEDDVNKKKKPAAAINCVNPNCMSGEDLAPPAMFVLSFFGLKRSKGQQVCAECFNMVVQHQEELITLLKDGKPMLTANFPSQKDVILLDSDEESLSDNESNLSDDTMSMIRENLDDVISETLTKFDFDFQLKESCTIINDRLTKLEEEASEITKRYDSVQNSLDEFRKQIYQEFQQEIREKEEVHFMECEIPPMPIVKSKLQNQLYNKELMNMLKKSQQEREVRDGEAQPVPVRTIATKKVSQVSHSIERQTTQDVTFVRSEAKSEPPPHLPPPGPLVRPKLRVGDLAYTMKVSYFSIWVHCRVVEVIPRNPTENDPSTETYRVKLENVKKNAVRTVTGKYLAYPVPARVQLKVGVRVIAIFKEEDDSAVTKDNYYVGVIAEPPKSTNKYRYLVFFDDGYTQYCPHDNVLVVCATSRNVWEDIHPEPRDFIRNYLQQYPERPMVKLSPGQIVKVEWNGRWWIVRVLEVDGSLVKVHFDADKRTEWIYRGSTRLGPMYQELAAAKERQTGSLLRSRGFGGGAHHKSDMPYVEYTRGDAEGEGEKPEEEKSSETAEEQAPAPRSVARKSTARRPAEPVISNTTLCKPLVNQVPEGKVRQRKLKPKCRPIQFRPHQCSEACVAWTGHTPAAAKKYDPLVKPLMFGFERLMGNFKGKTIVMYRAPCGRMIRTHQEMLCYLRGTRSQLTIDLFDFDFWVNPLNEFEEGSTFGKIEDLSYGKENVRISCVNELDHSMPQYVQYMTARQPAKDVNLNLDPEFLVGCDCTDDCEDRSKCSCWKLTLQGKAYVPDGDLDPLFGYQYRRLPERIATGIYECNSRCKCSMTCQNRVAQQPLSCRLQLFKTLMKGWGIRCLHDIPRGAFICIYAGFLLTEQEANEGGKTYGDEYLAELDYIESVENLKEGYESEARDMSDVEDEDQNSQKDTMDIEYENSADSDVDGEQGYSSRPGDIRLRLRRRTVDEAEKESRKSKNDDDAISISDDELDPGQCAGCRESLENVKDSLRCQGCMKLYHFRCTPLKTSENVDKLGSNKSSWICPKCDALVRKPKTFDANITVNAGEDAEVKYPSVRELYGPEENVYIMDAKTHGNIGRYLNHSCSPNVFVQNVFVDTHDLRFPWVAFFANQYIPAGTELTWDYNYDVGSVPGKVMLCYCGSNHCRGRLL